MLNLIQTFKTRVDSSLLKPSTISRLTYMKPKRLTIITEAINTAAETDIPFTKQEMHAAV